MRWSVGIDSASHSNKIDEASIPVNRVSSAMIYSQVDRRQILAVNPMDRLLRPIEIIGESWDNACADPGYSGKNVSHFAV